MLVFLLLSLSPFGLLKRKNVEERKNVNVGTGKRRELLCGPLECPSSQGKRRTDGRTELPEIYYRLLFRPCNVSSPTRRSVDRSLFFAK